MKWAHQLISKASQILEKFILDDSDAKRKGDFFTPPRSGTRKGKRAMATSRSLSEAVTAAYTIGSLVIICPSADMTTAIPLLYTIITSGNSDPKADKLTRPKSSVNQTAPSLYIQAWLTLGKICLADGKIAKSYIPLFVKVWSLTLHHLCYTALNAFCKQLIDMWPRQRCSRFLWNL